jgi:hypothetical protein
VAGWFEGEKNVGAHRPSASNTPVALVVHWDSGVFKLVALRPVRLAPGVPPELCRVSLLPAQLIDLTAGGVSGSLGPGRKKSAGRGGKNLGWSRLKAGLHTHGLS